MTETKKQLQKKIKIKKRHKRVKLKLSHKRAAKRKEKKDEKIKFQVEKQKLIEEGLFPRSRKPTKAKEKQNPNDFCACRSTKKYKKCCGKV